MKLLLEINESATSLIEATKYATLNLKLLSECDDNFGIEDINESAQQFLNTYSTKIENGEFKEETIPANKREHFAQIKQNVISIFAALQALSQRDLADAFDDQRNSPLGKVLSDFYGSEGKEQHIIASNRLKEIGNHPSVRSYRAQAEEAVNDSGAIRGYANKIRTNIEPVMNKMISQEQQQAQGRLDKDAADDKQANMGRPLVGSVPQRSTTEKGAI